MPPTLSPTGPLSWPFFGCAQLLAASPSFRGLIDAWLSLTPGTTTATQALNYIDYPYLNNRSRPDSVTHETTSTEPTGPFAIITDDDATHYVQDHFGASDGALILTFQMPVNPAYVDATFTVLNQADAELEFRNNVGAVLLDMLSLSNTPIGDGNSYWKLVRIEKFTTPLLAREDENSVVFYDAAFVAHWNR